MQRTEGRKSMKKIIISELEKEGGQALASQLQQQKTLLQSHQKELVQLASTGTSHLKASQTAFLFVLIKIKKPKMSQRQLNAMSPHLEYNFFSKGTSPHRSGQQEPQQDPREAHLLWHQRFTISNGISIKRTNHTTWNLSSFVKFLNTWLFFSRFLNAEGWPWCGALLSAVMSS